jgi:NTE family protein
VSRREFPARINIAWGQGTVAARAENTPATKEGEVSEPRANGGTGRGEMRVDLVFEGGGVKGIGLVGTLAVLEERGYVPQNVAGASAGAIVAALVAAGYRAAKLREIMIKLDFLSFQDRGWEDRIPLVGKALSLLKDKGVFEGDAFLRWVRQHLADKKVETFGDLVYDPAAAKDDVYRYKVQVMASDLTERRLLVLPRDAEVLGLSHPDELEVAQAVRMSMSLPFFFEPCRWENPKTGREHLIVDGGMLSNFPVWLFDSDGVPEWPTFGLRLVEPDPRKPLLAGKPPPKARRLGMIGYARSLVSTMVEAHDRRYMDADALARTIEIPTLGVRTADFGSKRKRELYESGRDAAEEFLSRWDFEAYKTTFRSGQSRPSRRRAVEALMAEAAPGGGNGV